MVGSCIAGQRYSYCREVYCFRTTPAASVMAAVVFLYSSLFGALQTAQHPNRVCFSVVISGEAVREKIVCRADAMKKFALRSNCKYLEGSDLAVPLASLGNAPS